MVNAVSAIDSTNRAVSGGQPIVLMPPSQLLAGKEPKNVYKEDLVLTPSKVISELSVFGVGALSGYKYNQTVVTSGQSFVNTVKTGTFKDVLGSIRDNGKVLGTATYNAVGIGALLSGGVSAVTNTGMLLAGKDNFRGAAANVVTDTIKGAVSGAGGMAVGGVSALALTMFKVTGTPVMIAGVVGGAIGAAVFNKLLNTDGLNHALRGN